MCTLALIFHTVSDCKTHPLHWDRGCWVYHPLFLICEQPRNQWCIHTWPTWVMDGHHPLNYSIPMTFALAWTVTSLVTFNLTWQTYRTDIDNSVVINENMDGKPTYSVPPHTRVQAHTHTHTHGLDCDLYHHLYFDLNKHRTNKRVCLF